MGKRPDPEAARRAELGAFLRAQRAKLQPEDVGLKPTPGRRNTPGLRREEVAQISGVGLTWYTWLEQGRPITTSAPVMDALAGALRLDREAHGHLRCLASLPVPEPEQIPDDADGEFARLLDTLLPSPACIVGPSFDFVVWNETFATIWRPDRLPEGRCNAVWMAFCEPEHRRTWVNWEQRSHRLLAELRAASGQHAGDPGFAELVGTLEHNSSEFRTWWASYEVRHSIAGPLRVRTAQVGIISFDVVDLRICTQPTLRLSIHAPARPADERKLNRLGGRGERKEVPVPGLPRDRERQPRRRDGEEISKGTGPAQGQGELLTAPNH
jgi:hypothetical protein